MDRAADITEDIASKVPAVTLGFWVIKILATTLGETGGDTVSMTLGWGYLAGTAIFLVALLAGVADHPAVENHLGAPARVPRQIVGRAQFDVYPRGAGCPPLRSPPPPAPAPKSRATVSSSIPRRTSRRASATTVSCPRSPLRTRN